MKKKHNRLRFNFLSKMGAAVFFLLFPASELLAHSGSGHVNMKGEIMDSACAIDSGSTDQTINLQVLPIGRLIYSGEGTSQPFFIKLINCTLSQEKVNRSDKPNATKFSVTFDGDSNDDSKAGLFSLYGSTKGMALQISDAYGNKAAPGSPLPQMDIPSEDFTLNYTIRLVGNSHALQAGGYRATVRFKMDYY